MKISDEATQAAAKAIRRAGNTYTEMAQAALTAALPFLTGVKVDPWGWVIHRGGDKKPIILEASKFDQASAAAEADTHDLGYFPIYTQPAQAPSPRTQALEEVAFISRILEMAASTAYRICAETRHVTLGEKSADAIRSLAKVSSDADALIPALSSQPVVDGWFSIETAPNNQAIMVHYDDGNIEIVTADDNDYSWIAYTVKEDFCTKPTHWRPLPASPGASHNRPTGGSDEH